MSKTNEKMKELSDRMRDASKSIDDFMRALKESGYGGDNSSDTLPSDEHLSRSEGRAGTGAVDGGSSNNESGSQ